MILVLEQWIHGVKNEWELVGCEKLGLFAATTLKSWLKCIIIYCILNSFQVLIAQLQLRNCFHPLEIQLIGIFGMIFGQI
jgi:hypothetical protein